LRMIIVFDTFFAAILFAFTLVRHSSSGTFGSFPLRCRPSSARVPRSMCPSNQTIPILFDETSPFDFAASEIAFSNLLPPRFVIWHVFFFSAGPVLQTLFFPLQTCVSFLVVPVSARNRPPVRDSSGNDHNSGWRILFFSISLVSSTLSVNCLIRAFEAHST